MDNRPNLSVSEYEKKSIEETFKLLDSSVNGLADSEAAKRLVSFGKNEIIEKKRNAFFEFLLRYWGPMPWLLELAIALSFILSHYQEGVIIFALLSINAIIGQLQSSNSQKVIALLKGKLATKAKILRSNVWHGYDAKEIVVGDVISVRLGDIVPADTKIIDGDISVDQSNLTGESLPSEKHKSDILFSGSVVRRGEAMCIVINTGKYAYYGKTTELVKIAKPQSHQLKVLMEIIKYMMYLSIAASVLIIVSSLFMHLSILLILTFITIFLMGAIPVALPAILTIVQSVGAKNLAKKGALVTRLDSVEDAASIDIICFDKTGTITQNKLSVVESIPFYDYTKEDVLRIAALTSRAAGMDLIDLAIIDYTDELKVNVQDYKQVNYTPFDPSIKRTEAIIENGGKHFKAVKGAAQVIISLCHIDSDTTDKVNKIINSLSTKGYRIIAVAMSQGDDLNKLKLVGILPLADPPRADSKSMIEEARKLKIKPIMLTGDSIDIAKEISDKVGIGNNIIRIADIEGLNENEQYRIIIGCDGFAEIFPEDKYRIVKILQSRGHNVGMTGDGVNDAPALKQAEMGIAVNNSTDVAKAAASVVLTEPGIGVIIDAIKISRQTHQRMLTWVINKIVKVIEFVLLLTIGFFWFNNFLLTLLGVSLLVFSNDFATMSLATDNVKYSNNPNKWDIKKNVLAAIPLSLLYVLGDVIILMIGINYFNLEWDKLNTLVLLCLVFNSQFRVLIVRERSRFWSSVPGKFLLVSTISVILIFTFIGIFGIFISPLTLIIILSVLGLLMLFSVCIDFLKYLLFKKLEV